MSELKYLKLSCRASAVASILLFAGLPYAAVAQQTTPIQIEQHPGAAQPGDESTYSFRVNVRTVPVNVVVTDKKGNPIQGLTQDAFKVTENDVAQTITSFMEHRVDAPKATKLPPMGADVYTNYPEAAVTDSVTVLLLDTLNTPLSDQAFVRGQILKFLKQLPPESRIAVFTLSSRLRLLQGFTTDPAVLKTALNGKGGKPSQSILLSGGTAEGDSGLDTADSDGALGVATSLSDFENDLQSFKNEQRAQITLDALTQVAQYLVGIPGRKNLIWFASSFPLAIAAGPTPDDPLTPMSSNSLARRRMTDLMIRGQVALYPVSARGLDADMLDSASSNNRSLAANPSMRSMANIKVLNVQGQEKIVTQRLADDTGGKAYFDSNGLKEAIDSSIRQGSNYYTISYTPTNAALDQTFRRIKVGVAGKNYTLAYRSGYYADSPNGPKIPLSDNAQPSSPTQAALARGVPASTQIIFKVHVTPLDMQPKEDAPKVGDDKANLKGATVRYSIEYAASMRALTIKLQKDGLRNAHVVIGAVAYDLDSKVVNSLTQEVDLNLKPAAFEEFVRTGLKYEQVIDLPKSLVFLRLAIIDPATGNTGSIEIPLRPHAPPPNGPVVAKPAAAAK